MTKTAVTTYELESGKTILLNSWDVVKFWSKVTKSEDGCWEWQGYCKPYGMFNASNTQLKAHRVAWLLEKGTLPKLPMCLCHKCDNPKCVRTSHLFLGTIQENNEDCRTKGRNFVPVPGSCFGEASGQAKLTDGQVTEIHRRLAAGEKALDLRTEFGVESPEISAIRRGKAWRHLGLKDLGHGNSGRGSSRRKDVSGTRYGKLVVLRDATTIGTRKLVCKCDCGREKEVSLSNLSTGNTQSCGCGRS